MEARGEGGPEVDSERELDELVAQARGVLDVRELGGDRLAAVRPELGGAARECVPPDLDADGREAVEAAAVEGDRRARRRGGDVGSGRAGERVARAGGERERRDRRDTRECRSEPAGVFGAEREADVDPRRDDEPDRPSAKDYETSGGRGSSPGGAPCFRSGRSRRAARAKSRQSASAHSGRMGQEKRGMFCVIPAWKA